MRIVEQDLTHWAEGLQAVREQAKQESEAKTRTVVSRQKVETARAKRQVARIINQGASNSVPSTGTAQQPVKPKSVDDFMDKMFGG